jgi:uncharacterized OsmC-like protein
MDTKREMKVSITGESQNPTKITLKSGKFSMIIDEPKEMGGTDEGPSPIQVLLMSLAGCLNVTGHEIAREKGLELHGVKIGIEGVMNPCTFLGCSYEERAGFQNIEVKIEPDFTGATQQQIDEWLKETEERCPVTDNIKAGTSLSVSVR